MSATAQSVTFMVVFAKSFTKSEWLAAQFSWRAKRAHALENYAARKGKAFCGNLIEVVAKPRDAILAPLLALRLAQMRPDLSVVAAGNAEDANVSLWSSGHSLVSPLSYFPCFEAGILNSSVSAKEALSTFDVVFWQTLSAQTEAQTVINTREGVLPYFSTAPGSTLATTIKDTKKSLELSSEFSSFQQRTLEQLLGPVDFSCGLGPLARASELRASSHPSFQEKSLIALLEELPGIFGQSISSNEEAKLLSLVRSKVPSSPEKEILTRLLRDAKHSGDLLTLIELAQALESESF